jgi:hypothetical protein
MLSLIAIWLTVVCGPAIELAKVNETLELKLRVIEAFEHGPVIVEVSLTNRGKSPVAATDPARLNGLILSTLPKAWKAELRIPCQSGVGPHQIRLAPGEVRKERYVLQSEYVSDFPSGTHRIGVTWPLRWSLDRVVTLPEKMFPITITPATFTNRWALLARLEAEFAALPLPRDLARVEGAAVELGEKLAYARHKELIPLILRFIDRYPPQTDELFGASVCRELVATVFLTDPAVAHRAFVDRLIEMPPRIDPSAVFSWWETPRLAPHLETYFARFAHAQRWYSLDWWASLAPWHPVWDFICVANHHAPWVLPDAELRRLNTAKHPVVRESIEKTFGDRLKR